MVTAGLCIQEKNDLNAKRASNAVLVIGKNNLENNLEMGYEKVGVKKIILHPDWSVHSSIYDANIAVLVLNRKIPFTEYIRPICLWNLGIGLEELVSKNGVVVGWGFNENVR